MILPNPKEYIPFFQPFFHLNNNEDDEENILLPLRLLLAQYEKSRTDIQQSIQQLFSLSISPQPSQIPIETIRYIYILQQSSRITHQIPIGPVLEPIGLNKCDFISDELGELFNRLNLYSNEKFFEQKEEKLNRLLSCFERCFNQDVLNYYTYTFLPYGSYRLVCEFWKDQFLDINFSLGLTWR